MFRSPIVVIFRDVFFEGILQGTLKLFTNIKRYVLSKMFKICVRIQNMDKLFVLNCVFIWCVR
jgi:hypothetical protein